jgi:thioredoxin-like negative regulator of GroEL
MKTILNLTNFSQFETIIADDLCLVAFGTPNSSPCKRQYKNIFAFIDTTAHKLSVARVDVEQHIDIANQCNNQPVPTLKIYTKMFEDKRLVGLQSVEALYKLIDASPTVNEEERS